PAGARPRGRDEGRRRAARDRGGRSARRDDRVRGPGPGARTRGEGEQPRGRVPRAHGGGRTMNDQIASEFRKLTTTRSIYAMLAGLAVIVGLGVVAIVTDGQPGVVSAPLERQAFLHVSLTI